MPQGEAIATRTTGAVGCHGARPMRFRLRAACHAWKGPFVKPAITRQGLGDLRSSQLSTGGGEKEGSAERQTRGPTSTELLNLNDQQDEFSAAARVKVSLLYTTDATRALLTHV